MSGDAPDRGDERDLLAAEYLLGLLEPQQAAALARALEQDAALRRAVDEWAGLLEPLAALAEPVPPSDLLWRRIARDLPARAVRSERLAGRRGLRAVLGLAGWAVAAGLAAALLLSGHHLHVSIAWDGSQTAEKRPVSRPTQAPPAPPVASAPTRPTPPPPPRPEPPPKASPAPPVAPVPPRPPPAPPRPASPPPVPANGRPAHPQPPAIPSLKVPHGSAVALLTAAGGEQPAMKAYFRQGGTVQLVPVQTISIPRGERLGFWIWPHGTALPIALGRVGPAGGTLRIPFIPADGTPVMVTLEPQRLPDTNAQGPTLFTGQLVGVD